MFDDESFAEIMKHESISKPDGSAKSPSGKEIHVVLPPDSGDDGDYGLQTRYMSNGFNRKNFRQLQKNTMLENRTQDLHGFTVKEAHTELGDFLAQAVGEGHQMVYVIHGRGLHSKDGHSVLRPKVHKWLSNCDDVLAWQICKHNDGAIRVWLRKRRNL